MFTTTQWVCSMKQKFKKEFSLCILFLEFIIQELEGRQKLLEQSIAKFLEIRQELRLV